MKRLLVDYKKLDHKVADALIEAYPYGYGDEDIITLQKTNGEIIEAVEVRTEDTIYLVKISKNFSSFISNFEANFEKELDRNLFEDTVTFDEGGMYNTPEFEPDTDLEMESF